MAGLRLYLSFLLFLSSASASAAADPSSFIFAGCSQPKYPPSTPYQYNLDSLLTSLSNAAGFSSYANFTASAASPSSPAYGLLQCRADLPISDCDSCITASISNLPSLCPSAVAATIQLEGCLLRYANDSSFLGRPDTTLLYKSCGPNLQGGKDSPELLGMRDAALVAMQAAPPQAGTYRASRAGDVQAVSQCVGDLGFKECAECVATAVSRLGSVCGYAISGEVYLGKCYVKYASSRAHDSHSSSGDDAGKTLAIIIGLFAVIALVIISFSFLRKAGKGK